MSSQNKQYNYLEIYRSCRTKTGQTACGDIIRQYRDAASSTAIIMDGLGSGIKANLAAQYFAQRIITLLNSGFTLRQTYAKIAQTLHRARSSDALFAAFCIVRVLNDGTAYVISYEMPAPVVIEKNTAAPLPLRYFTEGNEIFGEGVMTLNSANALLCTTDGITQAGMGEGYTEGWQTRGVCEHVSALLSAGQPPDKIPELLTERAKAISNGVFHDDSTAMLLKIRPGLSVYVLTGPPHDKTLDAALVEEFAHMDGKKIVCGSTTADVTARFLKKEIRVEIPKTQYDPPRYYIDGVDLVTEGAIALNQLYNILEEDTSTEDESSAALEIKRLFDAADRIHFKVGTAVSPASKTLSFKKLGIMPRKNIVPLIAEKLKARGKLVIVEYV